MIKGIVVIPIYIFLMLEGFCGGQGGGHMHDIWDDVIAWLNLTFQFSRKSTEITK